MWDSRERPAGVIQADCSCDLNSSYTSALVAAYAGFHAEPTIEGTSVATTRAVVNASLLVLMLNFVMSALLFN